MTKKQWVNFFTAVLAKNTPQVASFQAEVSPISLHLFEKSFAFAQDETLQRLNLSFCGITSDIATYLADCLADNQQLLSLNLWGNYLDNTVVHALAKMLGDNHTLTNLNLGFNGLDNTAVDPLAEVLMRNSTLTTLNLEENDIRIQDVFLLHKIPRCLQAKSPSTLKLVLGKISPLEFSCFPVVINDMALIHQMLERVTKEYDRLFSELISPKKSSISSTVSSTSTSTSTSPAFWSSDNPQMPVNIPYEFRQLFLIEDQGSDISIKLTLFFYQYGHAAQDFIHLLIIDFMKSIQTAELSSIEPEISADLMPLFHNILFHHCIDNRQENKILRRHLRELNLWDDQHQFFLGIINENDEEIHWAFNDSKIANTMCKITKFLHRHRLVNPHNLGRILCRVTSVVERKDDDFIDNIFQALSLMTRVTPTLLITQENLDLLISARKSFDLAKLMTLIHQQDLFTSENLRLGKQLLDSDNAQTVCRVFFSDFLQGPPNSHALLSARNIQTILQEGQYLISLLHCFRLTINQTQFDQLIQYAPVFESLMLLDTTKILNYVVNTYDLHYGVYQDRLTEPQQAQLKQHWEQLKEELQRTPENYFAINERYMDEYISIFRSPRILVNKQLLERCFALCEQYPHSPEQAARMITNLFFETGIIGLLNNKKLHIPDNLTTLIECVVDYRAMRSIYELLISFEEWLTQERFDQIMAHVLVFETEAVREARAHLPRLFYDERRLEQWLSFCRDQPNEAAHLIANNIYETLAGDSDETLHLNPRQSTHTVSVNQSVSEAARKLYARYADRIASPEQLEQVFDDIAKWLYAKPCTSLITDEVFAAKKAFARLRQMNFIDKTSQISLRQFIALMWFSTHDKTSWCLDTEIIEHGMFDETQGKRIPVCDVLIKNVITAFSDCQRGDNLDENHHDKGGPDDLVCPEGSFNKIAEPSNRVDKDINIIYINLTGASQALPALSKLSVGAYLQQLAENADTTEKQVEFNHLLSELRENGISLILEKINPDITQRILAEYGSVFVGQEQKLAALIRQAEYVDIEQLIDAFPRMAIASCSRPSV